MITAIARADSDADADAGNGRTAAAAVGFRDDARAKPPEDFPGVGVDALRALLAERVCDQRVRVRRVVARALDQRAPEQRDVQTRDVGDGGVEDAAVEQRRPRSGGGARRRGAVLPRLSAERRPAGREPVPAPLPLAPQVRHEEEERDRADQERAAEGRFIQKKFTGQLKRDAIKC